MPNNSSSVALNKQIGGDHYKGTSYQSIEYCMINDLGPCEASVVKYVTRHKKSGGRKDIEKAIHYLEILIEYEYSNEPDVEFTINMEWPIYLY